MNENLPANEKNRIPQRGQSENHDTKISHYGFSIAGPSHLANGLPCQDAHTAAVSGRFLILAVADGVGSQESSDIGAKTAVDRCVEICTQFVEKCDDDQRFLELIRTSFSEAYSAVLDKAEELEISPGQMDSTLCCVIWDTTSKTAYVGQSGDSGAVCAHGDGSYELLTEKQNTKDGAVYCLCFENRWAFSVMEDVWTVMLCTDGVLDSVIASPRLKLLADEKRFNGGFLIDARMAEPFLHPYLDPNASNPVNELADRAKSYLENYSPALLNDDKTVLVGFMESQMPERMLDSYYEGPDWEAIDLELRSRIYAPRIDISEGEDAERAQGREETVRNHGTGSHSWNADRTRWRQDTRTLSNTSPKKIIALKPNAADGQAMADAAEILAEATIDFCEASADVAVRHTRGFFTKMREGRNERAKAQSRRPHMRKAPRRSFWSLSPFFPSEQDGGETCSGQNITGKQNNDESLK